MPGAAGDAFHGLARNLYGPNAGWLAVHVDYPRVVLIALLLLLVGSACVAGQEGDLPAVARPTKRLH